MKEAVTKVVDTFTQENFHGAFKKLLEPYNKCIATGEEGSSSWAFGNVEKTVIAITFSSTFTRGDNVVRMTSLSQIEISNPFLKMK